MNMPDQVQSSSSKGKSQTKAAIDNRKKLDLPLDFSFKDLTDIAGMFYLYSSKLKGVYLAS